MAASVRFIEACLKGVSGNARLQRIESGVQNEDFCMLRYGLQPDIYGRASQGGVLGRPILECHMNEKRCYWVATLLGCIALTLFVVNMTLAFDNTARKREIGDRQAAISRGAALHELTLRVSRNPE